MSLRSRILPLDVTENGLMASLQRAICPLWVISGHLQCKTTCPLYSRKRTCAVQLGMSALCQLRTSRSSSFNRSRRIYLHKRLSLIGSLAHKK